MLYLFTWRGEKTPTQAGAEPAIKKDYKLNMKGKTTMFNEIEDFTLGDLFAVSDIIGDKYLTNDELAKRSAELLKAQAELDRIMKEQNLDD